MILAKPIRNLIDSFEKLPGIGPKTAQRLAFYLLHVPQEQLEAFASSLANLKKNTVICTICYNVGENNPCEVCGDARRDKTTLCVVEEPLDVLAFEKTGGYKGAYHVLHGALSPLNNIGPEEIKIGELIARVKRTSDIREIILATNPNMEGEATAMYIDKQLEDYKEKAGRILRITRLGQGLPTGGDVEYADELTLSRALEGRKDY